MKKIIISCLFVITALGMQAQENPIRIGLKAGLPNVAGLEFEYVTPLAGSRVAAQAEASYIPYPVSVNDFSASAVLSYASAGLGWYVRENSDGRGLYLHLGLGYFNLDIEGSQEVAVTASDQTTFSAKEEVTTEISSAFLVGKAGIVIGRTLYFRAEVGLTTFSIPKSVAYITHYSVSDPITNDQITRTRSQNFGIEMELPLGVIPVVQLGFGITI